MTIILVGLNHQTAPVALREKMTLPYLPLAFEVLRKHNPQIQEAVILSTCNRLEIIAATSHADASYIDRFLANLQNIPLEQLQSHLYHLEGEAVVTHLMRVACGLESMILGESQILGQVTNAFNEAQSAAMTGAILSRLFTQAIHAGKRAHTETSISRFTTSVSHAAAQLVLNNLTDHHRNVLIIGAGEMAILAAKALQNHGVESICFINRTYDRAAALSSQIGGSAMGWNQLSEALTWADAVITATGAPHKVIDKDRLPERDNRPLLFVDVAVPRDVDINIEEIPNIRRYDIDDLRSVVDSNTVQRATAIPHVESIITQETTAFWDWYHSRDVTPVIRDLRRWATELAQAEVIDALNKLNEDNTADVINRLAHRLVNKLLHEPTVRLRHQAAEGNGHGYAHAVSELFGLCITECEKESCNLQCITNP